MRASTFAPAGLFDRIDALLRPVILGVGLGIAVRLGAFYLASLGLGALAIVAGSLLALVPTSDPVYTRAALATVADLRIQGVAVSGTLGDSLHSAWPSLFVDPARAQGALVRLVAQPGGAVMARLLAALLAHAAVVAVGMACVWRGRRRGHRSWVVAGVAAQAQALVSVIGAPPSLDEIEATGLSFAINALLPWFFNRRTALSDAFADIPPPAISGAQVALALGLAYGLGIGTLLASRWMRRRFVAAASAAFHPLRPMRHARLVAVECAAVAVTLVLLAGGLSAATVSASPRPPHDRQARGYPRFRTVNVPAAPRTPTATTLAGDRWWREAAPVHADVPSRVEIQGGEYRYTYLVNGQPEVIHGMGLNTRYAELMTPEERTARLDADFAAMRRMGVNTVLGWTPAEFDEQLMYLAQKHQLGVIPPFDLDPSADYTDPAVRAQLTEDVRAWVERYRSFPALRMWGLGNEVLHKIVHPAWLGPQDPARDRNARAFASWLVETADLIHTLDPDHPVTYRSAEDAFLPWVAEALSQRPSAEPRTWFAWGTNCYSDTLAAIVDQWQSHGVDLPLWVSEFAPGGMAPAERPEGFQEMWGYVRRYPERVLGGAVYAWTRNGPEEIDRTMGLTDDGEPVDPRLIATLTELFHEQPAASGTEQSR